QVSPLGPDAIGVHAFPSFLFDRGVDPGRFIAELLDQAAATPHPPTSEEALHSVVDMMSCKAAVKAGEKLRGDELDSLLALRESVERSSSCPHGRPTSVRLTLRQLEKLFHRA
ncbi:MAG: DNA mismatch repair protein MutL, partial [Planctomycetota bacterium]